MPPKKKNTTQQPAAEIKSHEHKVAPANAAASGENLDSEFNDLVPLFEVYQPKFVWATPDESEPKKMTVQEFCELTAKLRAQELKENGSNAAPPKVKQWREGVYYKKSDEKEIEKLRATAPKPHSEVRSSRVRLKLKEKNYTIEDINQGLKFSEENIFYRWRKGLGWEGFLHKGRTFSDKTVLLFHYIVHFGEKKVIGDRDMILSDAKDNYICQLDSNQFESSASLHSHGPDKRTLENYRFSNPSLKDQVLVTNMDVPRCNVIDNQGRIWRLPLLKALETIVAPPNKPLFLLWNYSYPGYWHPNTGNPEPFLFHNSSYELLDKGQYYYQFTRAVEVEFYLNRSERYGTLLLPHDPHKLLKNCREHINEVFFQISYTLSGTQDKEKIDYTVTYSDILKNFSAHGNIKVRASSKRGTVFSEPPAKLAIQDTTPEAKEEITKVFETIAGPQLKESSVKYYPKKEILVIFCPDTLENTKLRDTLYTSLQALVPEQKELLKKGLTPPPQRLQIQIEKPKLILEKMQETILNKLNTFSKLKANITGWKYDFESDDAILRVPYDEKSINPFRDLFQELLRLNHPEDRMMHMWEIKSKQDRQPRIEISLHQPWVMMALNEKIFNALPMNITSSKEEKEKKNEGTPPQGTPGITTALGAPTASALGAPTASALGAPIETATQRTPVAAPGALTPPEEPQNRLSP